MSPAKTMHEGAPARRVPGELVASFANVLAPPLILLTPLISYLSFHRYDLWRPESLISIGAILLTGLAISGVISLRSELLRPAIIGLMLILFLDLQFQPRSSDGIGLLAASPFISGYAAAELMGGIGLITIVSVTLTWIIRRHLGTIVSSIFGVTILSIIFLPPKLLPIGETHRGAVAERKNLAPVVHLVLDAHIGLAGLPKDIPGGVELRRDLEAFYKRFGFTVFPRAYSPFSTTYESIPNLLNGEVGPRAGVDPENDIRLKDNRWFRTLAERGYRIRVYQTDFLDFCSPDLAAIQYCLTVPSNSIYSLKAAELAVESKAWIILSTHLSGALSIGVATRLLSPLGIKFDLAGHALRLLARPMRLGSISAFSVMDRIAEDLRGIEPGTAIFAHLMAPHGAFIHDADCRLKPDTNSWAGPWAKLPVPEVNTPATRRTRYLLYFDQVRCTHRKLARIFDAMRDAGLFADATIIVHGDHGSRISVLAPLYEAADRVSRDDLIDFYSALFAVRRSDMAAGRDQRQRSVHSLFTGIMMNRPVPDQPTEVFTGLPVRDKSGGVHPTKPMPDLGD